MKTSGSEQLRAQQIQTTRIRAQCRLGDSTTALIDEAEDLRDELLGGAFVAGDRLMALMLRAREAAPSLVFEIPSDVESPAGPFDERQHHLDILSRYTMALYQSQRPAIVVVD
ncbi:MAG: hypothetical protein LC790_02405 [Actinobacteria bacterium]|nr:hypothetical protein [Actinomycetota bacterium]